MNELALFAGAGGGLLASKWLLGWRTICYVELEAYPVACLVARIKDGLLDDAPIWDNATTFNGEPWRGVVDIVTAGFPCQPFSQANTTGRQKGWFDKRNLWPDTIRIIREARPKYVLVENVPGILRTRYFGKIISDLARARFDCQWQVISAAQAGAPHKRDRLWIVAYPKGQRVQERKPISITASWWNSEPGVGRVANGVAHWNDRVKALGEGQVPEVVRVVWKLLNNG